MGMAEASDPWTSQILLARYRDGDERAAEALFVRYFERIAALARGRLSPPLARRADPEDVAISVYRSFFLGAREGRFALGRGGDLWRLLSAIAVHKLLKLARRERAARRSYTVEVPLGHATSLRGPSPDDEVAIADELEHVFAHLDAAGRRALGLRLEGRQVAEIAAETGRSERSVRRDLARARSLLSERLDREVHRAGPETGVPAISHRDILLRRMIGSGRTGKVYEARRLATGRAVAVKFLRKSLLEYPGAVRRFLGEAHTLAGLRHPNLVGFQGLGRTPGGSCFLVMDLVDGPNLAELAGGRGIAEAEAVRWTIQVCKALEHAHGRGVIHCDLKPANILLDCRGTIRVTDFDLARLVATESRPAGQAGIEGTAPFMAPEQVSPSWGRIDERTDVYGIGAVLYSLLTGRPPFPGRALADVLADVASVMPAVDPGRLRPDLSSPLAAVCGTCLAKPPEARFQTVRELRLSMERL